MTVLSEQAVRNAWKHLVPEQPFDCTFLANFEPPDLIFGLGEIIPQYFALLKITRTLEAHASAGALREKVTAIFRETCADFSAFERYFLAFMGVYESGDFDLQSLPFRSNFFINFYGLRSQVSQADDRFQIEPTFDDPLDPSTVRPMTNPQVNFAIGFFESVWGLSRSSSADLVRGINKDTSSPNPAPDDIKFVKNNLGSVRQYMVRRACKYLLYDVAHRGGTVHYALDGINLDKLADETGRPGTVHLVQKNVDKVPVCTSEIRELFRMWNYFRREWRVWFYEELETAPAPWNYPGQQKGWAAYARHIAQKSITKLELDDSSPMYQSFQAVIDDLNDATAITRYHDIPYANLPRSGVNIINNF